MIATKTSVQDTEAWVAKKDIFFSVTNHWAAVEKVHKILLNWSSVDASAAVHGLELEIQLRPQAGLGWEKSHLNKRYSHGWLHLQFCIPNRSGHEKKMN
jgi:hypothetical protein